MGHFSDRMEHKLRMAFNPSHLIIRDDSHRHAGHMPSGPGHAPVDGSGETHFTVEITSEFFRDRTRVECQRLVYAVLESELKERVHALSLECKAPG